MLKCLIQKEHLAQYILININTTTTSRLTTFHPELIIHLLSNKKHLKNVGPIHHCEPPHAHSPDVASGTVTRHLRIDVHDIDNDDIDNA